MLIADSNTVTTCNALQSIQELDQKSFEIDFEGENGIVVSLFPDFNNTYN